MSQKLPVKEFIWYNEYLPDFNEDFIRNYDENSDVGYFLEVDKKLCSYMVLSTILYENNSFGNI